MVTKKTYNLIDLEPAVKNIKEWFDDCWASDPGMAVKGAVQLLQKKGNNLEDSAHTIAQWAVDNGFFDEGQLTDVERRIVETFDLDVEAEARGEVNA